MHNAAFAATGLPHVYLRYPVPAARLPRAVRTALSRAGCARLTIANRPRGRGERLAGRLSRLGGAAAAAVPLVALERGQALEDATLVVNATPLALAGAGPRVRWAATPRG